MPSHRPTKILFLITQDPLTTNETRWHNNSTLPSSFRIQGAEVHLRDWRDEKLTMCELAAFDRITFLCCSVLPDNAPAFQTFVGERLRPLRAAELGTTVVNDVEVVLWGLDPARCLRELGGAGFAVASQTRKLICVDSPLIEDVEPALESAEYSFIYIAGNLSHVVQTTGHASAKVRQDQVPEQALEVVERVMGYLLQRFSGCGNVLGVARCPIPYCRIDGFMRSAGGLVLVDVKMVDPQLWLDTHASQAMREKLCQCLM